MLNLLSKIVGPNHAVSVYVALRRFGMPVLLGLGFLAVLGGIMLTSQPRHHEHVGYVTAQVVNRIDIGNASAGVVVDLALPDGGTLRITETEAVLVQEVTDTACLEHRRFTDNGEARYRIKPADLCIDG
jgi:hypothetical protein